MPVDVKVVLIGERGRTTRSATADPDFRKLFGVRADFAADMPRTPAALHRYAEVVAGVARARACRPSTADALGALVEEGRARAGRRDRADGAVLRHRQRRPRGGVPRAARAEAIERDGRRAARGRARPRGRPIEERLQAMLEEGTCWSSTSGRAVGQVNGLSVYDLGYHAFGKPTRITASAAPGRAGIINVEREAQLSGGIYDKGVLIISGYLRRRYADLGSLSLTASLAFEQSYAGVDGDSASIAEVVALLSEIAGLPVDQASPSRARSTSTATCSRSAASRTSCAASTRSAGRAGSTARTASILPAQNVRDLMLPREIVEDVAAGRFHVFAVRARGGRAGDRARHADRARSTAASASGSARSPSELADAGGGDLPPTAAAVRRRRRRCPTAAGTP